MQHKFLKLAGVKTEKEFYTKFPTEEAFFKVYPEAVPTYKDGGSIHIKPENKGKFTAYKKRTGKTTEEALHSEDPHVRQMANFARNAAKWKHAEGGVVPSVDVNTGQYYNTRLGLDSNDVITPLPTEDQLGPKPRKPIIVDSPNDPRLKAYNDSLKTFNLANLEQKNYYNGKSGVPVPFSKNPQFNSANEFIDSHYGEYTGNSYNRAKELNTVAKRARIKPYGQYTPPPNTGGIGDQYPAYFKKPVQPVVYQKPQPKIDKVTGWKLLEGTQKDFDKYDLQSPLVKDNDGIYRSDLGIAFKFAAKPKPEQKAYPIRGPLPKAQVRGAITPSIPEIMPQPEGDYIYGPANSVIGINSKNGFVPWSGVNQRGTVNNPDTELLNNPDELKKYLKGKGYKKGGKIKGDWGASLGGDPILPAADMRFSTATNVDIWGNAAPLNGAVKPPTYASTFPTPNTPQPIPGTGGNPAWENYPGLGVSAKIPTNPNAPKMLPNPDYIQNTGEGQLNMGKNPNKTPGQNKYDQEAVKTGGPSANKNFQMPEGKGAEGSGGQALLAGLMAFDALMPKEKIRRRYLRPEDLPSYNPNQYGTGSQAINKNGGKIKGEKAFWGAIIGAVAGKASNKADTDKKNLFNNVQESLAPLMGISQQSQQEADRLNNLYLQGGVQNTNNLQTIPPPQYYMYGGKMKYKHGGDLQTHDGGNTSLASYNPFDGGTFQFNGDSHEKGGIDISYKGNPAEVEGGETAFKDQEGDLKIMGNLKVPGTNMKYKAFSKKLADKEEKAQKYIDKGSILLNTASPEDPYELLAFNSGRAMTIGGLMKQKQLSELKQHLGDMQEAHLEIAMEKKKAPEKLFKAGGTMYAEDGATLASEGDPIKVLEEQKEYFKEILKNPKKYYKWEVDQAKEFEKNPFNFYKNLVQYQKDAIKGGAKDSFWKEDLDKYNEVLDYLKNPKKYTTKIPTVNSTGDVATSKPETINNSTAVPSSSTGDPIYEEALKKAAEKYGVNYATIRRLVEQESSLVPGTTSNAGAMGVMQFMPGTAKKYGLTKAELLSTKPEDVQKQIDAGVKHFKELLSANNNDEILALAAYNSGQGTVNDFRRSSKKSKSEYTGEDLLQRMEWKRANQPSDKKSLAQNSTYDYIKNIYAPVIPAEQFRKEYYEPKPTDGMFNGSFKVPDFNYTPKPTDIATVQGDGTPIDLKQPAPLNKPSNARVINPLQFLGEGYALATNQEEPVKAQLYTPELYSPYQVSFQDRLNENQSTFNSVEKQLAYDPTSLATLAGQKYSADSNVLADEFRTNQGIANDIINKNVSLLNEAEKTNLGILDQQYTRQTQAKANTKRINQDALSSISSKLLQKEASNNQLRVYENLYQNYSFDPHTGKALFQGPKQGEEKPIDYGIPQPLTAGQPAKTVVKTSPTGQKTTTDTYEQFDPLMEPWKIKPKKSTSKPINIYKMFRGG